MGVKVLDSCDACPRYCVETYQVGGYRLCGLCVERGRRPSKDNIGWAVVGMGMIAPLGAFLYWFLTNCKPAN